MNCARVNNLLSAYLDGEVTGEEQLSIRDHLRACRSCEEELSSIRMTKRMLSGLSGHAPRPEFEEELISRLNIEAASAKPRSRFDAAGWWALLAEPTRARLRAATVCTAFGAAALLWATVPFRMPQDDAALSAGFGWQYGPAAPIQSASLNDAWKFAPAASPESANPPALPLRGYMLIHNNGEDAQWGSSGATIAPAADTRTGFAPAP